MPLDKNMSHEEMVKELIDSYKKTGKIGATEPRDMKHALEIANAVAYNIGESKEVKAIERNVEEMTLDEILESMERIISAKEKELGIFSETLKTPYEVIFWNEDEKWEFSGAFETLKEAKDFVLNHISDYPDTVSFEIRKEKKSLGGGKPNVTKEDIDTLVSEALEENPKVKVTLDSGETFETEVDPATSEDELEKQYKAGTEINVGKEGQERKAKIKSATLTKQVGEKYNTYEEDVATVDNLAKKYNLNDEEKDKLFGYLMTAIPPYEFDITPNLGKAMEDTEVLKSLGQYTNEDLENPPAVIENPTDVVSLDIPLLMRLLEWSREQAGEDIDLHVLTENLVEAMKDTEFLTMDDYERLVPCEECKDEEIEECDGSSATTMSGMGVDTLVPMGRKNKVIKSRRYKKLDK